MNRSRFIHRFVITAFCSLYIMMSIYSMIHVVEFFEMTNTTWLAIFIAIAFEVGAAASLASIIVMERMKMWIVWGLFILLTAMQINGNVFHAFNNIEDFRPWIELWGLGDESVIFQKRVVAIVSGALLPITALGFIKALVDYIRPEKDEKRKREKEEGPDETDVLDMMDDAPEKDEKGPSGPGDGPEPSKEETQGEKNDEENINKEGEKGWRSTGKKKASEKRPPRPN